MDSQLSIPHKHDTTKIDFVWVMFVFCILFCLSPFQSTFGPISLHIRLAHTSIYRSRQDAKSKVGSESGSVLSTSPYYHQAPDFMHGPKPFNAMPFQSFPTSDDATEHPPWSNRGLCTQPNLVSVLTSSASLPWVSFIHPFPMPPYPPSYFRLVSRRKSREI